MQELPAAEPWPAGKALLHSQGRPINIPWVINWLGHLEKSLVSDKSHVKHGMIHLFAKGFFSGLFGLGEKFDFFEVPIS
jgi:hypothetical protein